MLPALKILYIIPTIILSFFIALSPALAQSLTPAPITAQNYKAPEHSAFVWKTEFESLGCTIIGRQLIQDSQKAKEAKCPEWLNGKLVAYDIVPNGGALGGVTQAMAALYTSPPISSATYLADLGNNLGIVQTAYAQGVGGSGDRVLLPILAVWKVLRNIAYLFFTLIFLAVGLMIMFRQKINPQTVISAQAALPGLVIGLILVTFSYFISALIVDLSFVGTSIVVSVFQQIERQAGVSILIEKPQEFVDRGNLINAWWTFINPKVLFDTAVHGMSASAKQTLEGVFSGGWLTNLIGGAIGGIFGLLASVVIIIALLIQLARLLWTLISAYITILAITILSPLIILISSIPGRSGTLSMWWKTLLANVLAFPAIIAVFLFASLFLEYGQSTGFNYTLPMMGTFGPQVIPTLIGYGILLGSPAIPKMIKDAMGVKDIQGIPQAAMGGAMAGWGAVSSRVGGAYGFGMKATGYANKKDLIEKKNIEEAYGTVPGQGSVERKILTWLPKVR